MKKTRYLLLFVIALFIMPLFVSAKSVITVIEQGRESEHKITNNYGWTFNFKNVSTTSSSKYKFGKNDVGNPYSYYIGQADIDNGYFDRSVNYHMVNDSGKVDASVCDNNQIYMLYKNVGMYQGKKVNLKITVKDCVLSPGFDNEPGSQGYPSFVPNIGFSTVSMQLLINGLYSVKLDYEFTDDTGKPIDIKGYGTFTDLDDIQAFEMGSGIDKAYILNTEYLKAGKKLKRGASFDITNIDDANVFVNADNAIQSIHPHDIEEEPTNKHKELWATVLFSGGKFELTFYNNKNGGMFVFTPDSLVPFAIEDPVKNVNKENVSKLEEYTYTTSHRVPFINLDGSNSSYTSYAFNDVLEPCLNVKDVSKVIVKNDEGTDVTKNFNIKLSESNGSVVVDAVAKNDFLTQDGFYGHEYQFIINAYVKDNYDLSKYLSSDKTKYVIPNKATVSITDNTGVSVNKDTNKVFVYMPVPKEVVPTPDTGKYTSILLIVGGSVIVAVSIIVLVLYKKKMVK